MLNFNGNLINNGETIAVALSGGKDSVALLHFLCENAKNYGVKVVAVNVEHGIRGDASKRDSEFCKNLCASLGVKIFTYTVNAPLFAEQNGYTLEQSARILRYDCFFDLLKSGACDKIAVAHHRSDNVETILFNIFRGSSLTGIKGIAESAYEDKIIRPILGATREQIDGYIAINGLNYVTDETNSDQKYSRNALRNSVIPEIKKQFPEMEKSVMRLARSAASDDEFLYSLAEREVTFDCGRAYIPVGLNYPVFSRAVIIALKGLGAQKDYDNAHIDALFELSSNITGKRCDLLSNLYGVREHDKIVIAPHTEKSLEEMPFSLGETEFNGYLIKAEKLDGTPIKWGDGALYFDFDKLPQGAILRTRRVGDTFEKFGSGGRTVSLKKFMTDKKIPASKKDSLPVIACDEKIFCLMQVEVSDAIKIDNNTQNVIKLTCIKKQ